MSSTHTGMAPADRRVRDQAREAVTVMVFSAGVSVAFATVFLVLSHLGR